MPRPAAWRTTTSHARFLSAFVALTLALSGGLLSAGVIVDPHGLFGTGRYPVLVATSRSEKVASLATASPPQALIFGSSIMMRVDPAVVERLTTLTTFNLSVDSGKSEDFVALLDYGVRDLRLETAAGHRRTQPADVHQHGERRIRPQAPGQRPAAPLRSDESGGQGLAPGGRLPRHAGLDVHERRQPEPLLVLTVLRINATAVEFLYYQF